MKKDTWQLNSMISLNILALPRTQAKAIGVNPYLFFRSFFAGFSVCLNAKQ